MRFWTGLILLWALVCGSAYAQSLSASPSQINLTLGQGQQTVPSQDITISNPGVAVSFSAALSSPASWASVQIIAPSATLPAGVSIPAVRVSFTTQGLAQGSYSTSVIVNATGRPQLTIPVNVTVMAPTVNVEPSAPGTFTQRIGTIVNYPFEVSYNGVGAVEITVAGNPSWLTIRPSSVLGFPSVVSAEVNTAGLEAGRTYEATINFTASALSSVPVRSVVLRILVASTLSVQPREVTFSGAPGSATSNPPSLPITVSNSGGATNYFINPSPSAPWIRVSKNSGFLNQNGSDTFDVRTDATNLTSTGEVVGTIEISAPGRPTDVITVRLQLSGAQDITVTPSTLSFTGQAGAVTSAPTSATVTVTNTGAATGYTLTADQAWIVLSKNAGSVGQNGSDTFTVAASPQLQTVGAKTGTITLAAPGRAPRSVTITFNVTSTPPPPDLSVNPSTLAFSVQAGVSTSVPASSNVTVGNIGTAVGYTVSADQPWVILDKLAGTIPENGSDSFPVRVTGVGQTVGTKTATITITAPGRTSKTVTLTMSVTSSDPTLDLIVTPGTLTFAGQAGTATAAPSAATVTVKNTGAATNYSVVVDQPWLSVTKTGGVLGDNGTDTFSVSASPLSQTAGTKTGTVTVSAPGRPSRSIAVTFSVTVDPPSPDLIVSPNALSFSAAAGETTATPATATVTLTNIGSPVGFALSADQAWIDLPSLAGSIQANGTATFTVGAKPQGLAPGTRTGTVSITAPGRPARSVQVTFTIRESAASADMTVSPQSMAFVGQAGTANGIPSSVTVTVTNAGSAVPYTLVTDQPWLVLNKNAGTLPQSGSDTFTVSASPLAQTAGAKSGTITVLAAGRPTRIIQVGFTVSAGEPTPDLLVVPPTLTFAGKAGDSATTPARQTVSITNVGPAVGYTISADKSWLTLSKLAGVITQNSSDTFDVTVTGVGVTAGVQTATITLLAPGRPTKTVAVTFNVEAVVTPPTDLTVAPSALAFTAVLGQPSAAPSPWRVTLTNVGPAVDFLAVGDQPWIVLNNLTGSLPQDGTATLLVSVNPSFLTSTGTRTGNILVNASGRTPRTITVTLNVVASDPGVDLVVLPATLSFNQPAGQVVPTPLQATVQVGNVGAAMGYTVSVDQTWITLSKNSGNIGQNGTDSFNVTVNGSGLSQGTRIGTISVASPNRPTRTVVVTFTIGGSGVVDNMSVTPTSLTTTGAVGGSTTTPAATVITVSNTGAAVQYSVTPNQAWIVVSKFAGSLPANGVDTFNISTIPFNLASGTYQGNVIVTAAGRPQATIGVTMILTTTGVVTRLDAFPPQLDFYSTPGFPVLGQSVRVTTSDGSSTNVNVAGLSSGWMAISQAAIQTPGQVSVAVTGTPTSLPVNGTVSLTPTVQGVLTADVPVKLQSIGATVYTVPRVADGAGFSTAITLANLDTTPAIVSLRFRRVLPDSSTITWLPGMENNAQTENVIIPVNGSVTWRTRGQGNQVDAGWAQVISAQKIGGFAVFRQSVQGRADQEAAVPVVSTWQQRILLPFDNTSNLVTSMAISNISETENGDVRAIFRDENGQIITGTYRKVLPPQGHTAFNTTDELTFLRNRRGTAEFVMTGGRMSALGLRFAASAFTSFEVQSLNVLSSGRLILPQIANSAGFFTTITLVNKDTVPATVSLRFYRRATAQGSAEGATETWNPPMVNGQPTQNVTIAPGSSVIWQTTGAGEAAQGWAEVVTSQQVAGFAVFTQRVAGRVDQEAAVPVNAGDQRRFLLPYDNTTPFTTTMALANFAEDTQALIVVTVRDSQNTVIGQQIPLIIPVRGHLADTLPQRFPQTVGQRGTIEFSVQFGNVSALGLRFAGEAFTSFRTQVIP